MRDLAKAQSRLILALCAATSIAVFVPHSAHPGGETERPRPAAKTIGDEGAPERVGAENGPECVKSRVELYSAIRGQFLERSAGKLDEDHERSEITLQGLREADVFSPQEILYIERAERIRPLLNHDFTWDSLVSVMRRYGMTSRSSMRKFVESLREGELPPEDVTRFLDEIILGLPQNLPAPGINNLAEVHRIQEKLGLSKPQYQALRDLLDTGKAENHQVLRDGLLALLVEGNGQVLKRMGRHNSWWYRLLHRRKGPVVSLSRLTAEEAQFLAQVATLDLKGKLSAFKSYVQGQTQISEFFFFEILKGTPLGVEWFGLKISEQEHYKWIENHIAGVPLKWLKERVSDILSLDLIIILEAIRRVQPDHPSRLSTAWPEISAFITKCQSSQSHADVGPNFQKLALALHQEALARGE